MGPVGKEKSMTDAIISMERIQKAIYLIRGQKVMLDRDLAALYGVPTKALKQTVKRNAGRFPGDFMLLLTGQEVAILRSQFVTSSSGGGRASECRRAACGRFRKNAHGGRSRGERASYMDRNLIWSRIDHAS